MQRLTYNGKELEDGGVTVAALGILSTDVLDLQEKEEDVSLLDVDATNMERRAEGFGGTVLGGRASSPSRPEGDARGSPPAVKSTQIPEPDEDLHECPTCRHLSAVFDPAGELVCLEQCWLQQH